MFSAGALFQRREDKKNNGQQAYDVSGAEALYCNSSSLAPSEGYYSEIEDGNEPFYSNSDLAGAAVDLTAMRFMSSGGAGHGVSDSRHMQGAPGINCMPSQSSDSGPGQGIAAKISDEFKRRQQTRSLNSASEPLSPVWRAQVERRVQMNYHAESWTSEAFKGDTSGYSEENIYEEVCEGSREPTYSNETVTEGNLNICMDSLSVVTPGQLSRSNSGSSSYLAELAGGPAAWVQTESMHNVEHFISSADDKLNTLTGMKSHRNVAKQTVPSAQKTAKTSRTKWIRSVASTAAQVAGEVKKTRVLLRSSDTEPPAQRCAKRETGQKPVIQHTTLDDPNVLHSPVESVDDEPIYATVLPHRKTKNIQGTSSDSHSVTHSSPGGLRKLPSVCAEFSADSECEWQGCPHLHVCAAWIARRCPLLRRCLRTHSLRTAHNISVLRSYGWHQDEQAKVRRWLYFQACCERLETAQLPPVCVDHARGGCGAHQCGSLHMCPDFVSDICQNRKCQLGHDLLGDDHNRYVLAMTGHEDTHARVLLRDIKACMAAAPRLL